MSVIARDVTSPNRGGYRQETDSAVSQSLNLSNNINSIAPCFTVTTISIKMLTNAIQFNSYKRKIMLIQVCLFKQSKDTQT